MAKFSSTTFGVISGRHGSAVAATTKDGTILKVYKAPANPNTEKQQAQRSKFGFVNKELNAFRKLFKSTFFNTNGMQKAISLALANSVIGESPNYELDYSNLCFSLGTVNTATLISFVRTPDNIVKVEWDTTIGSESNEKDPVNLVFINPSSKLAILKQNLAFRNEGIVEVELPGIWAEQQVHTYMYFTNPQSTQTSVSQYLAFL